MGHATHFLRRLDRLSDRHVELALTLYNDPELLAATLARATLPDGAERLAIALDDPLDGPFLVVTREGRFVTCLARGMRAGDLPVVTRAQLDAAAGKVERMREVLGQLRLAEGNEGLLRKHVRELYQAGEYASREQFEAVARWVPLFGSALLKTCTATAVDLMDLRPRVKNVTRPHRRHERVFRHYHETLHGLGHLYLLCGLSAECREAFAAVALERDEPVTWSWAGVRHDVAFVFYRGLWCSARWGKQLLPSSKRALREAASYFQTANGMLEVAAIGLAHDKLRAEAYKMVRAARPASEIDPRVEPLGVLLSTVLAMCFDERDAADATAVDLGRQLYHHLALERIPEGSPHRWDTPDKVPAELARAAVASWSQNVLTEAELAQHVGWLLPWLVRAEPADLYFPSAVAEAIRVPWSMERTIELLESQRGVEGVVEPRRSDKTPGRNDPCPCGSGKKYKRCCGASA